MAQTSGSDWGAPRLSNRPRRWATLAGISSFLFIALFGVLQFQEVQSSDRTVRAIDDSNQRLRLISDYLSLLQDIETGQRGYVLTGKVEFLQPQILAQRRSRTVENQLVAAYANSDSSRRMTLELVAAGRMKQALSRRIIDLRREQHGRDAAALIASGGGRRIMDRARALVNALERREGLYAQRLFITTSEARKSRQWGIVLAEIGLILSIAGLLGAMAKMIVALRRTTREVADSGARQAAIFEAANDAMVILDERGVIISANQAAERLFGRRHANMVGGSILALFAQSPGEAASHAYLRGIGRGDGSADATQTFVGARDDGTSFDAEVVTTPVTLHGGLHFLAVARDATERRRIERLKNEFVATISHELRTPLTSIAGALGLLSGGAAGVMSDKARRLLAIAQSNSERLIRLINDILDIEKIEAGKMSFQPRLLDLAPFLDQALHDDSGLASARNVTLTLAPVTDGTKINADPDRLGQVLSNLISNAVKYSPEGGTVTVSTGRRGLFQRISIADQGSGIPEEFQDRIFEKFAQADSTDTRVAGGTGLGLSIVREIITRMGGAVSYDSSPTDGATFHVDLPAQTAVSSAAIDRSALSAPSGSTARHLLHVDDDRDTLSLVRSSFEGLFEVRSAASVQEAEAALRRYRFDLVILDMLMSDGSGLSLVPTVRASRRACPIILYTAYDVEPAVSATVDAVCTKTRDGLDELLTLGDRLAHKTTPMEQQ